MGKLNVLVIDNFDSFTFTLVDYLRTLGAEVLVERNNAISVEGALAAANAILLSPGPGTPDGAGISVELAAACMERRKPLLGVCLGHQAIAVASGLPVDRVGPMHGKTCSIRHDGSGLFTALPSPMTVTRYHSLAMAKAGGPLIATAWSDDHVIMAVRHEAAPAYGVQFHPESIATEHGHDLLANFLNLAERAIEA